MSNKRLESKQLEYLVNEWKQGNVIHIPLDMFKSNEDDSPSIRCSICDWSYSNKKSLYHPEVEYYAHNSMQGNVCGKCQLQIKKMQPKKDKRLSKYLLDKEVGLLEMFKSGENQESVYDPITGQFSGHRKVPIRYE